MRARRGMILVNWERGFSEACLIQGREAARLGKPNDVETILARAWGYLYANLIDRGLPLLREALEIDPVNESAYWGLVVYASGAAEDEEAMRVGESYISRFGGDPQLHFWIGVRYQQSGDIQRALEYYQKASEPFLTESSFDSPASHANYQGLLFSGLAYERLGAGARARQTWRRGVELLKPELEAFPDNVKMRVFLACFYGVLGEQADFLAEAERAVSANVNLWELYYLAAVLARTGDIQRASDLLERIAQRGRIRSELDWFFELIASTPAPISNTLSELLARQEQRFRAMY